MNDKYILDGHKPIPEPDLMKWAEWSEKSDRVVKQKTYGDVKVSTVFLGIDHSFGEGEPLLFETMIFGGEHDQYQTRCSTWKQALEMHIKALKLLNNRRWKWKKNI